MSPSCLLSSPFFSSPSRQHLVFSLLVSLSSPSRHYLVSSLLVSLLLPSCLLSFSSPFHVCVLQWNIDSGLKMSLSIGIKFSSSCHHPVSSLLLSLLSTSRLLFSSPSRHHPVSSSRLPLVTILSPLLLSLSSPFHVCVLQWNIDSGLKRSLSIGIKFSSPSHRHPVFSL